MQNEFKEKGITIENNFGCEWNYKNINEPELIWLHNSEKIGEEDGIAIGIKDIPFIITTLIEIQEYYNNIPKIKINDKVEFISGRMIGLSGKVIDIDKCDNKRPLIICITGNSEISSCSYFCGYDEIKVIGEI